MEEEQAYPNGRGLGYVVMVGSGQMKLESWFQADIKGLECYAKEFCRSPYHSVRPTS